MPAERGAEGARRTIPDALGDLGDPAVVAPEQILGDGHAPGEQVFHRRQADGTREALEERRARKRRRPRELSEGLRPRELPVHLPHRWRQLRIGQSAQQPRRSVDVAEVVWRAANDVTGQLRFPAGPDAVALAQSGTGELVACQ